MFIFGEANEIGGIWDGALTRVDRPARVVGQPTRVVGLAKGGKPAVPYATSHLQIYGLAGVCGIRGCDVEKVGLRGNCTCNPVTRRVKAV